MGSCEGGGAALGQTDPVAGGEKHNGHACEIADPDGHVCHTVGFFGEEDEVVLARGQPAVEHDRQSTLPVRL